MTVVVLLSLLVLLPAAAVLFSETWLLNGGVTKPGFGVGVPVIYQEEEISTHPTPDAHDIRPAARGEFYYYTIMNYLRVTEVLNDGRIIAVARDNKRLCFWPNDSGLRKPRLAERLIYRSHFPDS